MEALVAGSIRNQKRLIGVYRMRAESYATRCLLGSQTLYRFEPLPIEIDRRNCGNRHIQCSANHPRDSLEALVYRRIKYHQ